MAVFSIRECLSPSESPHRTNGNPWLVRIVVSILGSEMSRVSLNGDEMHGEWVSVERCLSRESFAPMRSRFSLAWNRPFV